MRRALFLVLLPLLAACTSGRPDAQPTGPTGPVSFRVLAERVNTAPCLAPPDFEIANTEDRWIDVFDQETDCSSESQDVELPEVHFPKEVGVAAWWRGTACDVAAVRTSSVERRGNVVVVEARVRAPRAGARCVRRSGLHESFLALHRSALYDGSQPVRFELDGAAVGTATPMPAAGAPGTP